MDNLFLEGDCARIFQAQSGSRMCDDMLEALVYDEWIMPGMNIGQ